MKTLKSYQLNVDYFGKKFLFLIKRFIQKNGNVIYDLKCSPIHYIVINDTDDWTFIADITPCADLKLAIIAKLSQHAGDKKPPLRPVPQLALVPLDEYIYNA